jgi:hypothetical protein
MADEFPVNDDQFQDSMIAKVVRTQSGAWEITQDSGWSLMLDADSPVEPREGASLRLYGKGIGYPFRGVFVDGRKAFYRNEAEQDRHQDVQNYGADAAEYVRRWDEQGRVWSIEMGGLGPGYEQALQLAMVEVLRHLVATKPDSSVWAVSSDAWRAQIDSMHEPMMPILDPLGLSGAQWGAACALAGKIYADGPIAVLKAAKPDRKIQVSRRFPTLDPVVLAALATGEARA